MPVYIFLIYSLLLTACLCLSMPFWIILPASPHWHICASMVSELHHRSSYCYCMFKKKKKKAARCHFLSSIMQRQVPRLICVFIFSPLYLSLESSSQQSGEAWAHKCVIMKKHHFGVCPDQEGHAFQLENWKKEASHCPSSWTFWTTDQWGCPVTTAKVCKLLFLELN